jgi:ABC-2 type transport system permease protein
MEIVSHSEQPTSGALQVYDSSCRPHPFVEEWRELYRYRDLVAHWSIRNVTIRYKRSILGVVWTLIEPMALMIVLTIVFSNLFKFEINNFPIYLLSGLLMWDFFARASIHIIEENTVSQDLAQRIHVPRSAFALAAINSYLINWTLALIPLVIIMVVMNQPFSWALITVPLAMVVTAIFTLGLSLTVATAAAFFTDIKLAYQALLAAVLYSTPIIYPLEIVPEKYQPLILLNPLTHLCRLVRDPIYSGTVAPTETWIIALTVSVVTLLAGWWIFTHWRDAFDYQG